MIINDDCFKYLTKIKSNSIDLILTDPPYNISKKSFFKSGQCDRFNKMSIDFGEWDIEIDFDFLFSEFYRVLRKGGTLILFYDIWKSNQMKELGEKYKFKQLRVGQWVKNNPVPLNSKVNYLSNSVEYFFSFTKSGKPTFNSEYDKGIYNFTLCHGKERLDHPTQKPLKLIKELILKHSNPGDVVLDPFSGSGTTAEASLLLDRNFICIEKDEKYYQISIDRINNIK